MLSRKTIIIIVLALTFFILAPHAAQAIPGIPLVPCGRTGTPDCNPCHLFQLLKNVIDFLLLGIVPPLATLLFVAGGFMMLLGGAKPNLLTRGKSLFWNTFIGLIIIFGAWLIVNTLLKTLVTNTAVTEHWWEFRCTYTPVAPGVPPSGPPAPPGPTGNCRQSFSVAQSVGCPTTSACVNVNNLTPTHGCQSAGGNCLLSSAAAQRAQAFVSSFNSLAGSSGCTLKINSALQVQGGPSASDCHHPGNPQSGTCADFNLLPNHPSCYQYFYQAAQSSGAIVSFLDEYVPACRASTTTGGNIHVVF